MTDDLHNYSYTKILLLLALYQMAYPTCRAVINFNQQIF